MNKPDPVKYRDLDMGFYRHPKTNDVSVKIEAEAVKAALRNLIQLRRFEKPFHPEISCGIIDSLFENINPIERSLIRESIERIILKYEPRVKTIAVILGADTDSNTIRIDLTYTIHNIPQTFKLSVGMQRAR